MANFNAEMAVQLGEFLKKKREERKIDLTKVGEATFISPHYLEALEKGEWDKLPGRTYASGYLKIYSRFLGLDPQEILVLFNQAYGETRERENATLLPERVSRRQKKSALRVLIASFAILVALLIFVLVTYRLPIFPKLTREETTGMVTAETPAAQVEASPPVETAPEFSVVVVLQPENLSWGEVRSGDNLVFSGILVLGKSYVFKSNAPLEISGRDGDKVKVNFNGNDLGYLAPENGNFERTFGP
ncbi:MAG: helix-turn-helix domain-containing protein [Candidatus Caldatribacteriaceae bacterium]